MSLKAAGINGVCKPLRKGKSGLLWVLGIYKETWSLCHVPGI